MVNILFLSVAYGIQLCLSRKHGVSAQISHGHTPMPETEVRAMQLTEEVWVLPFSSSAWEQVTKLSFKVKFIHIPV